MNLLELLATTKILLQFEEAAFPEMARSFIRKLALEAETAILARGMTQGQLNSLLDTMLASVNNVREEDRVEGLRKKLRGDSDG